MARAIFVMLLGALLFMALVHNSSGHSVAKSGAKDVKRLSKGAHRASKKAELSSLSREELQELVDLLAGYRLIDEATEAELRAALADSSEAGASQRLALARKLERSDASLKNLLRWG